MLASSPRSPIVSPLFLKGGKDSSIRWKEPFETRVKEPCAEIVARPKCATYRREKMFPVSRYIGEQPPRFEPRESSASVWRSWSRWLSRRKKRTFARFLLLPTEHEWQSAFWQLCRNIYIYTRVLFLKKWPIRTASRSKKRRPFFTDSIFFNSFSYRRRVTRVDKSWKIRRKILSLPFRKTKFVLIQSQNGNLSIATREEETRFRFKFETTVRYAETIRSDLKTDSDTHTHT